FQYFKADFAKFKDEFAPQVTEAEITEYYEKNKEQFRELAPPEEKAAPESSEDSEKPSTPEEEKPGDETKPEATPDKPAEPGRGDAKESEKPADQPQEDQPKDEGAPKQSSTVRTAPIRLASFSDEESAAEQPEKAEQPAAPEKSESEGPSLERKD